MNCRDVDELGAAYAVGAVEDTERRAIEEHLGTCGEPHAELRSALGASAVLAASSEPVAPSPGLRDRVMATVSATPQEHRPPARMVGVAPRRIQPKPEPIAPRRWLAGWRSPELLRGLALGGVAAAVVLAVVAGNLWTQLRQRDDQLRAVAAAIATGEAAYRVSGDAGSGYLVDTAGAGATLVLGEVDGLPEDLLYALWLVDAEGTPVAAGTFRPTDDGIVVVPVDRDLAGFAAFALSVEAGPVDQPSGEPVLVVPLEA
jgi:anti-sigma-K factor RskA